MRSLATAIVVGALAVFAADRVRSPRMTERYPQWRRFSTAAQKSGSLLGSNAPLFEWLCFSGAAASAQTPYHGEVIGFGMANALIDYRRRVNA